MKLACRILFRRGNIKIKNVFVFRRKESQLYKKIY